MVILIRRCQIISSQLLRIAIALVLLAACLDLASCQRTKTEEERLANLCSASDVSLKNTTWGVYSNCGRDCSNGQISFDDSLSLARMQRAFADLTVRHKAFGPNRDLNLTLHVADKDSEQTLHTRGLQLREYGPQFAWVLERYFVAPQFIKSAGDRLQNSLTPEKVAKQLREKTLMIRILSTSPCWTFRDVSEKRVVQQLIEKIGKTALPLVSATVPTERPLGPWVEIFPEDTSHPVLLFAVPNPNLATPGQLELKTEIEAICNQPICTDQTSLSRLQPKDVVRIRLFDIGDRYRSVYETKDPKNINAVLALATRIHPDIVVQPNSSLIFYGKDGRIRSLLNYNAQVTAKRGNVALSQCLNALRKEKFAIWKTGSDIWPDPNLEP